MFCMLLHHRGLKSRNCINNCTLKIHTCAEYLAQQLRSFIILAKDLDLVASTYIRQLKNINNANLIG